MRAAPYLAILLIAELFTAPALAGPGQRRSPRPPQSATPPPRVRPTPATPGTVPGFNPGIAAYTRSRPASVGQRPQPNAPRPVDPTAQIATQTNFRTRRKPDGQASAAPPRTLKRPSISGPDDKMKSFKPKPRSTTQQKANSTIIPPRR
ncbi:MAG: hypothetical protein KatS3mg108_0898 [Isosphaeraceae bacterium]|jgi:hypothetical protein|nr:MAG: hypothetical protein KatS3mg108_0898 [Isosphaeraceae bacterium]